MKPIKRTRRNLLPTLTGLLLVAGFVVGSLTWADAPSAKNQNGDLAISLTARKVVRGTTGKEQLLPAERAFPGEVIQYDALYVNQGAKSLSDVSPMLPIPSGMVFVPDSAKPPPAEASLDGRTFASIPLKRTVVLPNGEEREEEVAPTEYRALRWHLGNLASGAEATVSARTKLIPVGR